LLPVEKKNIWHGTAEGRVFCKRRSTCIGCLHKAWYTHAASQRLTDQTDSGPAAMATLRPQYTVICCVDVTAAVD